jgi:hypothetical protein
MAMARARALMTGFVVRLEATLYDIKVVQVQLRYPRPEMISNGPARAR